MYDAIGCTCCGIQPTVPKYLPLIFLRMPHAPWKHYELQLQLSYSWVTVKLQMVFHTSSPKISPRDNPDFMIDLFRREIYDFRTAVVLNRCSSHYCSRPMLPEQLHIMRLLGKHSTNDDADNRQAELFQNMDIHPIVATYLLWCCMIKLKTIISAKQGATTSRTTDSVSLY